MPVKPTTTKSARVSRAREALRLMTVIEGRAYAAQHAAMLDAAKRGLFDIDVVSFIDHSDKQVIPAR